jgi:hypothetical protein
LNSTFSAVRIRSLRRSPMALEDVVKWHRTLTGALYGWELISLTPEQFDAHMRTPPVKVSKKKPPARETRVRDTTKDYYTAKEIAAETHWSETHVREWFKHHPDGSQVVSHTEKMHKRRYTSRRISPRARAAFFAAHAA